jgi:hypothetical protein
MSLDGDAVSPTHVYFAGMAASCANAVLVNSMDPVSSTPKGSVTVRSVFAGADGAQADRRMMPVNK